MCHLVLKQFGTDVCVLSPLVGARVGCPPVEDGLVWGGGGNIVIGGWCGCPPGGGGLVWGGVGAFLVRTGCEICKVLLCGSHMPTSLPSRTANSSTPIRATHHTYTIHLPARCIRDGGEIIHDSDLSKLIPASALPRRANQYTKCLSSFVGW